MESCWFSSLSGYQFGMIISNPPYIDENDTYSSGDVRFEPLTALVAAKMVLLISRLSLKLLVSFN